MKRKEVKDFLKKLNQGDPIKITWVDAGCHTSNWTEFKEYNLAEHVKTFLNVKTIGFYLTDELDFITVAQQYSSDTFADCMSIPVGMVREIRRVK